MYSRLQKRIGRLNLGTLYPRVHLSVSVGDEYKQEWAEKEKEVLLYSCDNSVIKLGKPPRVQLLNFCESLGDCLGTYGKQHTIGWKAC